MDSISEARLSLVLPALADKVRRMAEMLADEGVTFRVTQGLRTWSEQQALYDQGRTVPGKIVTDAKPGYSYHCFAMAVDVVPMDPLPDWNTNHPVWGRLVSVGVSIGLTVGALWRTFPDEPHFQLTGTLPVTPDDRVRAAFHDGGIEAVWRLAGLIADPTPGTPVMPNTPPNARDGIGGGTSGGGEVV